MLIREQNYIASCTYICVCIYIYIYILYTINYIETKPEDNLIQNYDCLIIQSQRHYGRTTRVTRKRSLKSLTLPLSLSEQVTRARRSFTLTSIFNYDLPLIMIYGLRTQNFRNRLTLR